MHAADSRGRHKIFLGMAAGVGKTYRMLQEGHAEAAAGRDVAIGLLETHGRQATAAVANGLELIPRRRVSYRGSDLAEMDLPAILRRAPELCLIDELAHTNPPGLEHGKRYEDVEDVLAAGTDVLSTVNVQHLESLNDQVTELTGVRVRETLPDRILGEADEVVLIDITPESLIDRLRAGQVYPPERVTTALNNFFKIENLTALREVSLRQVAEEVGAKRVPSMVEVAARERLNEVGVPQAVGERLLALVEPNTKSQRIVRRAWRSAQRLGAELDLLWVSDHQPSDEEQEHLGALRHLAGALGTRLLVENGADTAQVVQRVVRERGTTYILMGAPEPRGKLRGLIDAPLPLRLIELLPGVDLRIVTDRSKRPGGVT
ncbi:MAG: histidine kinase [Solirubrobacteraceae bacterium]